MLETKTIEIDEIITEEQTRSSSDFKNRKRASGDEKRHQYGTSARGAWKTLLAFKAIQWLFSLRRKKYGSLLLTLSIFLLVLLALPLGIIVIFWFILKKFLSQQANENKVS